MSNTPNDDILFELIKEHFGLDKRPFDTVIDRKTGRFHDAARYRDFASAVLARWGTPRPVVREPLKRVATIKSWTNGSYWRNYNVEWHSDALVEGTQLYAEIPAHGITQKGGG